MDQIQYNPEYFQQGFQPDTAPDLNVGAAQNQQAAASASQQLIAAASRDSQISQQNQRRIAEGEAALAQFSQTLFKQVEKKAYEYADDQYAEGLLQGMENPGTLRNDPPEDNGRQTLDAAGKVLATDATNADVVVPAVRGSRFFQMGVRRGQVGQLLETQYAPFLQSKIDEAQPKTTQELAVVMANAQKEFWAKAPVDRNAMSTGFLTRSVYPTLNKLNAGVAKTNRNRILADQSYNTQQESFTKFNADGDVASLLGTLAITTDANGNPLGYAGAWKQFTTNLTNGLANGTYTETDVMAMESQPIPGDPKKRTYGQLHGNKFATARMNARKAKVSLWNLRQNERNAQAQQQQQALLDSFLDPNDKDGFTEEQINEAADQLEAANPGFQATKLRNLTKLSVDAKTREKQEKQIEGLIEMGLLTPERLEKFDPKLQKKYLSTAQSQAKLARENDQYKLQLDSIKDMVQFGNTKMPQSVALQATPGKAKHPSVRLMTDRMQKYFRQQVAKYSLTDPDKAAQLAYDDTKQYFEANIKSTINGYESYFTKKEADVAKARIQADAEVARIDEAIQQPDFIDEPNSVFTNAQLDEMSKGYGKKGWSPDPRLVYIADKMGVDPLTILNKSRDAAKLDALPPTPAQEIVANELTPAQRKALSTIGNAEVSARTMGSFNKFRPELVPNNLGPVVEQAATSAGVPPAHIAAMMEIESGFNNTAPSYNGSSFGLMQINRAAHPEFFANNDWKDPQANANYGAQYYAGLLKQYNNDPIAAAMAYNGGPGNYEAYLNGTLPDGPVKTEMINHGRKFQQALYKYGGGSEVNYSPQALRGNANKLTSAATSYVGMDTSAGPDKGNNACVWAINKVLARAGMPVPWGNSVYVPYVKSVLDKSGTRLSGPEPGAIAIMQDNGSPPYPHIGLVQADGSIISNSSSRAKFDWVDSPEAYERKYGRPNLYYKL